VNTHVEIPTSSTPARPNLSTYLSQQILSLIRDRQLKPGDRLPSARALAAQFSVATPTIREALRRLQATGMIDIRHGSGIYVRRDADRILLSNPSYGALEAQTILQALDARLLIEPHLAELAAANASEGDIAGLRIILERSERALAHHDDERYIQINYELHVGIAQASGNIVLTHIVQSLLEMHATELHIVDPHSSLSEIRARDHHFHQLVVAAIAEHDESAARDAMTEHLTVARSTIELRVVQ
jgi:GntR family transcriptional regulator, transcriptional repressor for pyruvate dehydrogenase complex